MLGQVPDVPVPELFEAEATTPEIVWSAIAPALILIVGGILLLTVVSIARNRLAGWFHPTWAVVTATAAGLACIPLWNRVQDDGASSEIADQILFGNNTLR